MDPLMSRVSFCLYFLMIKLSTTQNIMALGRKKLYEYTAETRIQSHSVTDISSPFGFSRHPALNNLVSKSVLHQLCP